MNTPKTLPYSPVRIEGNMVFVAGQIGWDPDTFVAESGIEPQLHQAMKNLKYHLENNGSSLSDILKVTIFLTNMDDYSKCNEIYAEYVTEPYPVRTAVAVAELPRVVPGVDLVIEVEAVAVLSE